MQAVILAGGFGSRLKEVVKNVPKPMAPINNIPFLKYLIDLLITQNFTEIILLLHHQSEIIEEYFRKQKLNIKILYIKEENPLGTAGAVFNAWIYLAEDFFLINGDTFFDIDYSILREFIQKHKASALIALRYSKDITRYGLVNINSSYQIIAFKEKTNLLPEVIDGYINGGVYYFKKASLKNFYLAWQKKELSIERDIFPKILLNNQLFGLPMGGKFIDIGIKADYEKAEREIPLWGQAESKKALFIDRDNTIIEDQDGYIFGTNLIFINSTLEFMREANQRGELIIVISNQAGVAKGYFKENDVITTNNYIKDYCLKLGIIITGFYYCTYSMGATIEQYRKQSLARKPNPGLILKACEDYKISLKDSQMLGDSKEADLIKLEYLTSRIIENSRKN